ncbi:MAG TPA: amidohydrolase family protein [Kofleriaceae bacterium]
MGRAACRRRRRRELNMRRLCWGALAVTVAAIEALSASAVGASPSSPTYAFTGGQWWNGSTFVKQTLYTVEGRITAQAPKRVDETIDLTGGFVIPPLAEGHTHWIPQFADPLSACYLADGVFYAREMAGSNVGYNQFRDRVNLPTSIDFVSALQGFTGPGGHPVEILERGMAMGVTPKDWKPDFDPYGILIVRTERDVDERMKLLVAENPDFVKVFLIYSDQYEARLKDPATRGSGRGMDPKLLPHLVQLAHAAGLKVHAHGYSVEDFRTAVRAGVDEIAHMPGHAFDPAQGVDHFRLTAEDAKAALRAKVKVTTTLANMPAMHNATVVRDQVAIPNLKLLKSAGVPILVGSDEFNKDVLAEVFVLRDLAVFSNAELLNMVTRDTAQDIFPNRKLGRLAEGYEADFLVLDRDPTASLDNLRSINLRVKQGRRVTVPEAMLKRASADCMPLGPPPKGAPGVKP